MKIYFAIIILLISLNFISAEEGIDVNITNGTIYVKGYTDSLIAGKVEAGFFSKINDTLNLQVVCQNVSVNNDTYQNNCTIAGGYQRFIPFNINQSYTAIIGDTTLQRKYEDCINDKALINAGLSSCVESKVNMVNYEKNFTQCRGDILTITSDKNSAEKEVEDLNKKIKDNENQKWIFLIVGGLAGAGIILYKEGKVFGNKVSSPEQNFNQTMAA